MVTLVPTALPRSSIYLSFNDTTPYFPLLRKHLINSLYTTPNQPPNIFIKGMITSMAAIGQITVSNPFLVHNSINVHTKAAATAIIRQLMTSNPPLKVNTTYTEMTDVKNIATEPSILFRESAYFLHCIHHQIKNYYFTQIGIIKNYYFQETSCWK